MADISIPTALEAFDTLPNSALVNDKVFAVVLGCSRNTIWRRARAGIIPKPIRVSTHHSRWRVGDIRKVLAALNSQE